MVKVITAVHLLDLGIRLLSAGARHRQIVGIFAGTCVCLPDVIMVRTVVEDDVWIGFNATIMKGKKIEKGEFWGRECNYRGTHHLTRSSRPLRQVGTASKWQIACLRYR